MKSIMLKTRKEKSLSEFENLKVQTRRKEKIKKELVDVKWVIRIILVSFSISFALSFVSETTISNLSLFFGILVALIFVSVGIIFDIVGVSVTAADPKVFHSMNSRRVKGADIAVKFIKNNEKVSSFCCDVIGDICGVISGSTAVAIAVLISKSLETNLLFTTMIVTGIISSLTIGGKAIGKSFAINKCDIILYEFSKVISVFYKCK